MRLLSTTGNPASIRRPPQFTFGGQGTTEYATLRARMLPAMDARFGASWRDDDTLTKAVKIRQWVRDYLDLGFWFGFWTQDGSYDGLAYTTELYTASSILSWHDNGNDGYCSMYATFFMHCCLAVGVQARRIGWTSINFQGDQVAEVYVPEWQKWVLFGVIYNAYVRDVATGIGLSACDMCDRAHAGTLYSTAEFVTDGSVTDPTPFIYEWEWAAMGYQTNPNPDKSINEYAWDVALHTSNGTAFWQPGSNSAYVGYQPSYTYEHIVGASSYQSRSYFDWDAQTIRTGIAFDDAARTATISIADSYVPLGLDHYAYSVTRDGVEVQSGTFTGTSKTLGLTGTVEVAVWGVNTLGGVTNTVRYGVIAGSPVYADLKAVQPVVSVPVYADLRAETTVVVVLVYADLRTDQTLLSTLVYADLAEAQTGEVWRTTLSGTVTIEQLPSGEVDIHITPGGSSTWQT